MSAVSHSLRLARIDVTRTVRKNTDWRDSASAAVSVVMYVLLIGAATLGGGYLASQLGETLVESGTGAFGVGSLDAMGVVRGVFALFWLVITVIYAVRAVGQRGTLAQPEGILTVVPTVEAVAGVLLAEYAFFLLWTLPPAVGVGAGLALGTGQVWPALALPLGVAGAGVAAVGIGYPLGLGIRHVATRFAFVARNKSAIVFAVFVVYFAVLTTGAIDQLMVRLFEPMGRSPIGWYADLVLLGTPGLGATAVRAGGAGAVTLALATVSLAVSTVLAGVHWFSDPALAGAEEPVAEGDADPGIERRLAPILGPATASLVALSWRRAVRSPLKLLYAFYPMLVLVGVFADVLQTGEVPTYLPYATTLFVAWAAGVIFTLNPLGDQGAALSSTLLSPVDGRTFVRALLVAGLVVAIPLGTLATAAVAFLSPIDRTTAVGLTVAAPVVMVVAAGLSVGIGMAFPKFEATNVTRSMKTVIPSLWAFVLFTAHLLATAVSALFVAKPLARQFAAGLLTWVLPFGLDVSAQGLYWAGAVAIGPLLVAPVASYRYAVRRFDRYTIS